MGYRVGDLELHPGIAGEFGYDSNFFYRGSKDNLAIVDVLRLRVTPSVSISTLGPQRRGEGTEQQEPPKVNFRAGVAAIYNEYIRTKTYPTGEDPSKFRNVGALANFNLHILPDRPWGAQFYGDLMRSIQPSNFSDTSYAFNRIQANAGGEIIWAPGGGLFDWRIGGRYDTTIFENDAYKGLNNSTGTINTRGRWRFLPRTALMFDASQGFTRYTSRGANSFLLDSDPLRARVGLSGLITQYFGFLGMFGWGTTFSKAGGAGIPAQNYDGPIGQLQLTFYPTPPPGLADAPREASLTLSQIGLGYTRDFTNSYFGSFYTRDRGYLNISYFFAGRVLVALEGGVSRVHFPTVYYATVNQVRSNPFDEMRIDSSLFTEYRFTDSLGVNATLTYDLNNSKIMRTDPTDATRVDDLSWKRFTAFLGVRWFM
ncbi:MAG: hypothetical protein HY898_02075 [Deltaproteobacteria bacterium]|nr:hypothetical protein [Deltaproteobacteria bacterium]